MNSLVTRSRKHLRRLPKRINTPQSRVPEMKKPFSLADFAASRIVQLVVANCAVAAAIALAGILTYMLQKGHSLTLIWPAGGIALSAVILKGPWITPGILIPLFLSCLLGGEGITFSIFAPLGTMLAILGGAELLNRAGWQRKLSSSRDVLLLLGLGGLLPMMATGFWTSLLLIATHAMPAAAFLPVAWLYGCANTTGTIVLAPVLLMVAEGRFSWKSSNHVLRSLLPLSCCAVASVIAFGAQSGGTSVKTVAVLAYLPFPFLIWTALSRGLPAAAAAILAIITVAVAYTSRGMGPFASVSVLSGLWQYEVYIAILTSTGLLLGVGSEAHGNEVRLREESLVREAELERIKAQIHPHFLFNSLNAIHSLIGSDPNGARGGILSLSRLLRTSLDTARKSRIPLGKEMEIIRSYLELQKMRFEEDLETEIDVLGASEEFPVPPMTIQPLVENAVKHGAIEGTGSVSFTATTSGDWLAVTITNLSKAGNDPATWKEGVGLASVRARLKESFGDRAELNYSSTPGGKVTTSLRMPRC